MYFKINDVISAFSLLQLGIFLIFLFHKGKKNISNMILAAFFFTQLLAMVYTLMFGLKQFSIHYLIHMFFIGLPSSFLWAPLLYFYIKSIITENFSFNLKDSIHLIPFLYVLVYISYSFHFQPVYSKYEIIKYNLLDGHLYWLTIARNILVLFYNLLSLLMLYRYEKSLKDQISYSENQNLKWLRYILYGYIVACLVNEVYVFTESLSMFSIYNKELVINITFLVFFNMLFYKALISPYIFAQIEDKPKYLSSNINEEEGKKLLGVLENYMITSNAYLVPTLTIKELSKRTSIPDRTISQVINQFKNQNFSDFINSFRVNKAKELLLKLKPEKTTMLAIALDSGFNSRNAFNEVFKKHTSMSPTEFRKRNSK